MLRVAILLTLCIRIVSTGYVSKLVGLQQCKDPVPPFVQNRLVEDHINLVRKGNHSLVSGNITFFDTCKGCKWTVSVVRENRGVKRHIMRFKDMTCKHMLIQVINKVFGIPMDNNNCAIKPGTYVFSEMDINLVEQKITYPFRNNGVYYYTCSMFTSEGTQACYEVKALITLTRH